VIHAVAVFALVNRTQRVDNHTCLMKGVNMLSRKFNSVMAPLVVSVLMTSNVSAASLSASQLLPQQAAPSISRADVTRELVRLGLSEKEATERLSRVSDAELEILANQAQSGPAGAGTKTILWGLAAVGVVAVYFLYK